MAHQLSSSKQKGATLFTALIFLALMTIVSVSAAKISMLDVLVAGNNQQQMMLFQKAARELNDHASPANLLELLQADNGRTNNFLEEWNRSSAVNSANPGSKRKIKNRVIEYSCGAIGGLATSQGSENSCRLFDFEVITKDPDSNETDRHVRGVGKQYPGPSRNNFNN